MGKIIIQKQTTSCPITLIGQEAGICYGTDTSDDTKNYKRGIDCLECNHGRTLEFPDVYLVIDGYSARFVRELYTHIGGSPTRLQASTRYIDYESNGFDYVTPKKIESNPKWEAVYKDTIDKIQSNLKVLNDLGCPKEEMGMLLPLCMSTKVVAKYNLRTLIDMSHTRMCTRAYAEFREFFADLCRELRNYSYEWEYIVEHYFKPKCELTGTCTEKFSCGRKPKKCQ